MKWKWIAVIAILVFIALAWEVFTQGESVIDKPLIQAIELKSVGMTGFYKFIAGFGSTTVLIGIWLLIGMVLAIFRNYLKCILLTISILSAWLLNSAVKMIIQRDRPSGLALIEADGFGFPSGNAMIAIAFYGFIAYLLWQRFQQTTWKWLIPVITIVLIVLIGMSRIVLGVHYPSDILAGYALGAAILSVVVQIEFSVNSRH